MTGCPGSTVAAPTRVIEAPAMVIGGCGTNDSAPGTVNASICWIGAWVGAGVVNTVMTGWTLLS